MRKRISGGHECSGFFYLDTKLEPVDASALSASVSPFQWHCRLGHPSLSKLKQLLPFEAFVSSLECESFELGKNHRASLPVRVEKQSYVPFACVHSDVWGPC